MSQSRVGECCVCCRAALTDGVLGGLHRELIKPKDEDEDENGEDEEEDDADFIPRGPQDRPTASPNRPVRPTGNQAR